MLDKQIYVLYFIFISRHYSRLYMNHQVINGNHGNRNVGQYLSNQNGRSPYHVIDEDSQLPMIQENVNSDAKVNRFRVSLFNKILNDINNN